jgi:hypothetical protein
LPDFSIAAHFNKHPSREGLVFCLSGCIHISSRNPGKCCFLPEALSLADVSQPNSYPAFYLPAD